MILYLITNTPKLYRNSYKWVETRQNLEELSGDACIVLHYSQVTLSLLERIRPWAICHSGGSAMYSDMPESYWEIIRQWPGPQIGFCAGHQFIAYAFGSKLKRMRKLRPQEPDPAGCQSTRARQFKEWGVYPVQILQPDPLFQGCKPVIYVQEFHFWEVTQLSPELQLLASSATCKVQAFKHQHKFIYGTQFHPEIFSQRYPDGKKIVSNFFHLARAEAARLQLPVDC
ncbi:MAG: C26 family cysteine hydrolase domain-containing family [Lentisphaerae bacterium]|jgi:GMP synthase-like glutamine amidotransferase|nr:C26 family cysteine hydrolase domain-containing family [Lentisphaerota bacterium]